MLKSYTKTSGETSGKEQDSSKEKIFFLFQIVVFYNNSNLPVSLSSNICTQTDPEFQLA